MSIGIEQLESALASLNVLVAFLDRELRFVRVNAAYAAMAGKPPEFFVGKGHFDRFPDAENEALFRRVLATGEPLTLRARAFVHPDQPARGTTWWDVSLQPMAAGAAAESSAALALILIDVTDHVRAVQRSAERERELADKSELLRALLDATQESALLMSGDGTLLAMNEVAARRLGTTPEQALGCNAYELLPPELAKARRQRTDAVLRRREAATFEDRCDGRRLLNAIYPVVDADGEARRVAVYAEDVTELRELEEIEELASAVNQAVLEGASLPEVLQLLCQRMTEIFDLPLAWIGRKEADGSVYIAASAGPASGYLGGLGTVGVRWDDSPLGRGPAGAAIRTGHLQIRKRGDARFKPWAEQAAEFGLNVIMGVPLIVRGNVYGALLLYSRSAERFDGEAMKNRIKHLAGKICLTLEIATDHQQVRLLGTALATASNAIMITDRGGTIVWVNAAFCELSGYAEAELLGRRPSILKSGQQDDGYYRCLWQTILAGKVWSGETTDRRKDGSLYTVLQRITPMAGEDGEVSHFITVHEDITERLEAEARIQHMAHHDALTGLPNRTLFFDRVRQGCGLASRNKFDLTVMYMDLDGFKAVNDSLGHDIGDLLLQQAAQRMQACIRSSDTLARLGGDEFAMILYDSGGRTGTERIAEKILHEVARPFDLRGHAAKIGVSIGIALGGYTCDVEGLLRRADEAMYAAKRTGKNRFAWHASSAEEQPGA